MLSFFATLPPVSPVALAQNLDREYSSTGNPPQDPGSTVLISQTQAKSRTPAPVLFKVPKTIRPLPGELDQVPVFNSNNPEIVRQSGILLSTFPESEMKFPDAHLDYPFKGRFDLFSHHISRSDYPDYTPTLYLGVLIKNASSKRKNAVEILQAATFLGTPDAPYIPLPPISPNDIGRVHSGPGDRVSDTVLRGIRQRGWSPSLELEPGESAMLMNLPVPLPSPSQKLPLNQPSFQRTVKFARGKNLSQVKKTPSSNARSTLMRLDAQKDVYVASMAMFAPLDSKGRERAPTLTDWQRLLKTGRRVYPRDRPPSELNSQAEKFYYGRVAGVSRGSLWSTRITDSRKSDRLTAPKPGEAISFGISTLQRGTFGTKQIQSAPMLARYADTAYLAHGNYGVHYKLVLPLYNSTKNTKQVHLSFHSPVKSDEKDDSISFFRNPPDSIFFRGTLRLRYRDDNNRFRLQYLHLVHRRGERSSPLLTLNLEPKQSRLVSLDFVYPPDATPPQVLSIRTEAEP